MNEMLKRGKNESLLTYFKRITDNRKEFDLDYSEWAELILGESKYSSDNARKAYYIIKPMLDMLDKDEVEDDNKGLSKLEKKELSLKKEKEKLKDLRRRMNKEIRECARRENTIEMIEEVVKDLINEKPLVVNKVAKELEGNEAVLNFSDFHLGIAINNYFNEYNEEIAIKRIEMLTEKVIQYCDMHNITKLHLALNGDLINGYKYLSLIADKDMSVVKSTVRASEIISDMISKFCKHLNKVDLYFAIGNHASMKQTKDCLDEDNFEYFVLDFIKLRTKDLKNLEIHRNKYSDDIININIGDKLIIVTHGDKDKPKTVINKLCTFLDERPHFVMLGHYHHYEEFDQNNINIKVNGSIVSTDGYAFKLRLNSRACQTLVVHDKNGDEICTYKVKLS